MLLCCVIVLLNCVWVCVCTAVGLYMSYRTASSFYLNLPMFSNLYLNLIIHLKLTFLTPDRLTMSVAMGTNKVYTSVTIETRDLKVILYISQQLYLNTHLWYTRTHLIHTHTHTHLRSFSKSLLECGSYNHTSGHKAHHMTHRVCVMLMRVCVYGQ